MHLFPLLSATIALCLTQLAVGLPQQKQQQQQQRQEEEQQLLPSHTRDRILLDALKIAGAVGAIPVLHSLRAYLLRGRQGNLQNGQEQNGQNQKLAGLARAKRIVLENSELRRCMYKVFDKHVVVSLCVVPHLIFLVSGIS